MFTPISLRNAKHSVLSEINVNSLYSKIYFAIECLDCEREIWDCLLLFIIFIMVAVDIIFILLKPFYFENRNIYVFKQYKGVMH